VVLSALVPMFYRLLSTMISTQIAGVDLPFYTWVGIFLVFVGSLLFLLSPGVPTKEVSSQANSGNEKKGA
jgi:hypothetical protein